VTTSATTCDYNTIASDAQAAAASAGYSVGMYAHLVYAFANTGCSGRGWSTVGGTPSHSWINGPLTLDVVAHELGHGLGLFHAHSLDCGSTTLGSTCSTFEYGDIADAMGNTNAGHYSAFQKERLGWLNTTTTPKITAVTTSGTYTIDPYETATSAPKALKILKSTDPTTGARTWYYIESRQAIGYDAFLGNNTNVLNGILVHTGSDAGGDTSFLLDMTPASGSLNVYDWADPALTVGQTFSDPAAGITITNLSVSATGATVAVGVAPTTTTNSPTGSSVVVTTNQATYTRGQTASITAKVSSNGSALAGVGVSFTITRPNGTVVTASASTGADGRAVYNLRLRKQDPVGTYQATGVVAINQSSTTGATSFAVR
jgi:hypothetical protein